MHNHYQKNKPLPGMTETEHVPYRKKGPRPGMVEPESAIAAEGILPYFGKWELDEEGLLTVFGKGNMPDWKQNLLPDSKNFLKKIRTVHICFRRYNCFFNSHTFHIVDAVHAFRVTFVRHLDKITEFVFV